MGPRVVCSVLSAIAPAITLIGFAGRLLQVQDRLDASRQGFDLGDKNNKR
jgi:hypothetical protein